MNWTKATTLLDINDIPISELNIKIIKKKYYKLSLLHHPDKNGNTNESKLHFQDINEAYTYLSEIYYYEDDDNSDSNNINIDINDDIGNNNYNEKLFSFSHILKIFIESVFDKKYTNVIHDIINSILNNYETISVKLFDGLEKETCLMIYTFLMKHRTLLHLHQNTINQIRDLILKKYDNVFCYRLNPKLNDLFESNVYQLKVEEQTYIVPLWHNEIYFSNDISGIEQEIIVLCEPTLPPNITIDENNNIIIDYNIAFESVFHLLRNNRNIEIELDVNRKRKINVELSKLFIKKHQTIVLNKQGIAKIKDDIYDIEEKSDIVINIHMG